EHEIAVDEGRDEAVRVEAQICGVLVRVPGAVDEAQLEGRADLLQSHVRRHAGVAGIVVERRHLSALPVSMWRQRTVRHSLGISGGWALVASPTPTRMVAKPMK